MSEVIALTLIFIGSAFLLLASVGVLRMPDLYMRLQASAKAATLGLGCLLLGLAVHFSDIAVTSRALLTIVFLVLTAPVAAHMIGRAAYIVGVPLWHRTIRDDLRDQYDEATHTLNSPPQASPPEALEPAEETAEVPEVPSHRADG
jgi:multicomponent Na+:H+ antiporter subunit G